MPSFYQLAKYTRNLNINPNYKLFNDKHFITYSYNSSCNLGDYIQNVAIKNALKNIYKDKYIDIKFHVFDRDNIFQMAPIHNERWLCIMQGWYSHSNDWLPNQLSVLPVWIGTHLSPLVPKYPTTFWLKDFNKVFPQYFSNKIIGCRDLITKNFLQSININSYLSRCLTLTFKKDYELNSKKNTIFLVDIPSTHFSIIQNTINKVFPNCTIKILSQKNWNFSTYNDGMEDSNSLLDLYKNEARLIITTALHCASPCIAMGIPTLFIQDLGYMKDIPNRSTSLYNIYPNISIKDLDKIDLENIKAPEFEDLKKLMITNLELTIQDSLHNPIDQIKLKEIRNNIESFISKDFTTCIPFKD